MLEKSSSGAMSERILITASRISGPVIEKSVDIVFYRVSYCYRLEANCQYPQKHEGIFYGAFGFL
jgi:hypothetical protein